MCGILGLIDVNNSNAISLKRKLLENLFFKSEIRGKEASGFCFANDKEIIVGKTATPASSLIKTKGYSDAFNDISTSAFNLYFGHARLVTHGYEQFAENNQPVYLDNIILVHNGIVVNYKKLWLKYFSEINTSTDLDSEIIVRLYRKFRIESKTEELSSEKQVELVVKKIFDVVEGVVNIAIYDAENYQFMLASNNGSLYYNQKEVIAFASEKTILEKSLKTINVVGDVKQIGRQSPLVINLSCNENQTSHVVLDLDKDNIKKYVNTSLEHTENIGVSGCFLKHIEKLDSRVLNLKRCTKCLLPETFPGIHFDENGVCNVCNSYSKREVLGKEALLKKVSSLPNDKPILVAFSGGRDSSYCLHYLKKELGLNCIAYSYDWGMLTDLGRRNQSIMCSKLGVEHILVSADIRKKRRNIKLNVDAWLKKPSLGMIPLFMAGDKQYFYHADRVMKEIGASCLVMGENYLEKTGFKTGFTGAKQTNAGYMAYHISNANKLRMINYYIGQFLSNPAYINKSIIDTVSAAMSYYASSHEYLNLFDYIKWDENEIDKVLIDQYSWQKDPEVISTWRIGDGTAAFYNYIYYVVAGFTEADTFRSNQIRAGLITREKALSLLSEQNQPRWSSIKWYCDVIGVDFERAVRRINEIEI